MVFTLLIWLLLFLIYISDKHNKINQWCAISGIFFSLGTLKEYLYFELAPVIIEHYGSVITMDFITAVYSFMTAMLYYLAMPSIVLFAFYFSSYPARCPKEFRYIRFIVFIPAFILSLIFSPARISYYQHSSFIFWYTVSGYNLLYGILMTVLTIRTVLREKAPTQRRQKRVVSIIVLPPVWYWLITIFVIHSLGISSLMKVWKNNTLIVALVIIFYISAAFREGIMGMRLRGENYHWDSDMEIAGKGAQYTSHILKNEVTKIEWCVSNLSKDYAEKTPEELAIIQRSTQHLKQFVNKTQFYSNDIVLKLENVQVRSIIQASILSMRDYVGKNIEFRMNCEEQECISCDKEHIIEVLNNLISNAADAMENNGSITISYTNDYKKHMHILSVSDEGHGISKENMYKIFESYFTTKKTNTNFGLGLTYCANVMKKHKGYIDVKSEDGRGSTFYLFFPFKY